MGDQFFALHKNSLTIPSNPIDKLLDYDYLAKEILIPIIPYSLERTYITDIEAKILRMAIEK